MKTGNNTTLESTLSGALGLFVMIVILISIIHGFMDTIKHSELINSFDNSSLECPLHNENASNKKIFFDINNTVWSLDYRTLIHEEAKIPLMSCRVKK